MTASIARLSKVRLHLERALLMLRERDDPSGQHLRGVVSEVTSAIAEVEATVAPDAARVSGLQSQAHAILERVCAYAVKSSIRFSEEFTPYRRDTDGAGSGVDLAAIRAALASTTEPREVLPAAREVIVQMEEGATSPPAVVRELLEEAQLAGPHAVAHDTIPCPPITQPDLSGED